MLKILMISFLSVFVFSTLRGETKTYWDTVKPYHKMTHIYWNVRSLDTSAVRFEEFRQALQQFIINCRKLQKKVEEYQLGDDLMFDKYALMLDLQISSNGYNRQNQSKKGAAGASMRMDEIPLSHLFMLLSNDFKTMREAGIHNFPTPNIQKEWIPVLQYIRMFRYFREVADRIEKYSSNYAWGHHFDNRLAIMLRVSTQVQKILKEKMPELVQFSNIETETRVLLAYSRVARKNNSIPDVQQQHYSQLRSGGQKSKERYEKELKQDMRLALHNIERILNRFRNELQKQLREEQQQKQKQKQDQLRKQRQAERDKRAKETQLKKEAAAEEAQKRRLSAQEKATLNKMSDDALAERLAEHYNAVFPQDHANSISKNNVQKCMDMLTVSQKEYYESVKARYIRTGNNEKQAELKALKKIRPLLNSSNLRPSRAEMIRMLNQ